MNHNKCDCVLVGKAPLLREIFHSLQRPAVSLHIWSPPCPGGMHLMNFKLKRVGTNRCSKTGNIMSQNLKKIRQILNEIRDNVLDKASTFVRLNFNIKTDLTIKLEK